MVIYIICNKTYPYDLFYLLIINFMFKLYFICYIGIELTMIITKITVIFFQSSVLNFKISLKY